MISLENIIMYTGASGIIYCLIKALAGDSINDTKAVLLVIGIMVIVIFVLRKGVSCRKEGFKTTEDAFFRSSKKNGKVIEGIFHPYNPQPELQSIKIDIDETKPEDNFDYGTTDKDLIDFMNISHMDKKKFTEMRIIEKKAKEDIRNRLFTNEMKYTETNPFNTIPLGRPLNSYTYLPEFAWFRGYEKPPVCIPSGKECSVCPLTDAGTSELMHFSNVNSYKDRAPQGISLEYTKEIFNQE